MNIDNIKLLRNHIAKLSNDEFDINIYHKCFLGHGNTINIDLPEDFSEDENDNFSKLISMNMSQNLDSKTITIPVACAVLDNLINTGKVDWDYAIANPAKLDEVI